MALENLKDIFENTGFGGGIPPKDPTPPEEQTPDIDKLKDIYKPFSQIAQNITFGNPVTTDYTLGTGIFNNSETYLQLGQDNIKKRSFDTSKIGQNINLGQGDFTFETLYNVDQTAPNIEDRKIIKFGQQTINTGRPGMGALSELDIFGHSSGVRGREPYFVTEIGSEEGPASQRSRILEFYKSPAGINAVLKENATNFLYAPNRGSLSNIIFPALPALSDSVTQLSGLGLGIGQADAFVSDLGPTIGSLRRLFTIEYSQRPTFGLPFKNLGDGFSNRPSIQTDVISEAANELGLTRQRNIEIPFTRDKSDPKKKKELKLGDKLREGVKSIASKIKIPVKKFRRTPFIDLSGGPGNHNDFWTLTAGNPVRLHGYDDKISKSTIESTNDFLYEGDSKNPLEDETFDINAGDFYLRIKDLRDNTFIYFRGYITGITENVSPSYSSINYVGRSEPVYIYERAERDLNFTLRVYPNNIEEFNAMYVNMDRLTSMAYPDYYDDGRGLSRMKPPFTEMYMGHIGSRSKGQFGYIKSISYTVPGEGDWDANQALPRLFDIAISYQILGKKPPSLSNGTNGEGLFYGSRS
jgi:hypothetical protein